MRRTNCKQILKIKNDKLLVFPWGWYETTETVTMVKKIVRDLCSVLDISLDEANENIAFSRIAHKLKVLFDH
jgi:hypothetical protein